MSVLTSYGHWKVNNSLNSPNDKTYFFVLVFSLPSVLITLRKWVLIRTSKLNAHSFCGLIIARLFKPVFLKVSNSFVGVFLFSSFWFF